MLGYYYNDKKNGFGKYHWADGRKYIGYWENGKQSGYGNYFMANGTSQLGVWSKGKRTHWLTEKEIEDLKKKEDFMKIINEN